MPASSGLRPQNLNLSSFHGCIRNLYINHELQDFTRGTMKPGVEPGCRACRKIYCEHGVCQPDGAQVWLWGVGVASLLSINQYINQSINQSTFICEVRHLKSLQHSETEN